MSVSECVVTRSKARSLAGAGGDVETMTARSSHCSSRETLKQRLRVEYEAEKELATVKEGLIRKKLQLDLLELEEEEEVFRGGSLHEWADNAASSHVIEGSREERGRPVVLPSEAPRDPALPRASEIVLPPAPLPATAPRAAPPAHELLRTERAPAAVRAAPTPPAPAAPARVAHHPPVPPPSAPAAALPVVNPVPQSDILRLADVILSKQRAELPTFDGNPVEWLSYKAAYEQTAPRYSEYDNILRLRSSLRGEAAHAVGDLLRTGSDPREVISALEEDFGHPNLLLESALRKIRSLPRVSESGRELRTFTAGVRNCVYILRNIRADGYINNPQITTEILNKLTPVQRSKYGEYVMRSSSFYERDLRVSPDLNMVLEFLNYITRVTSYYQPLCVESDTPAYRSQSAGGTRATFDGGREGETSRFRRGGATSHRVHASVDVTEGTASCSSPASSSSPRPGSSSDFVGCALCKRNHLLTECVEFARKNEKDKWDFVKSNKLCFKCIVKNHSRYRCTARRCDKCRSPHHTLLHYERNTDSVSAVVSADRAVAATTAPPPADTSVSTIVSTESVTSTGERFNKTLLKILPVSIIVDNVEYSCYALLDDGATVSLLNSSVCSNLSGPTSPLKIVSASGHIVIDNESRRVNALIRGPNGDTHSISLRTINNIDLPPQDVPAKVFDNVHLRDLEFCKMSNAKPMLLIGQDNWDLIVNVEIRQGKSGQPVASRTKLGWVIHGPLGTDSDYNRQSINLLRDFELHDIVKEQFELESIGINEVTRKNVDTERACRILDSTSRRISGGWEVGLLWSRDDVDLPNNYDYALKRLRGVENKLKDEYAELYTKQIDKLINERYASRVTEPIPSKPKWYLPHFGVSNPNKPGKLRLVYDAAAKYKGVCLNDVLLTGPDLLNSLLGVLFKFRTGPVAYTGDISDMFLRIKIRKEDQGAQMFLWRGQDRDCEPDTYVMDSMLFGAKSSPTSAIYILNKNAREFEESHPEAVKAIRDNHYMDDYLDSVDTVDVARKRIEHVSMIHAAGGFTIRGWVTNSPELRRELPEVVPGTVALDTSPYSSERTLGMIWVPEPDELGFDLSFKRLSPDIVEGTVVPSKREFLKVIMSVFDPLGILCPFTIKARMLLQKVWKSNIEWDECLKDEERGEWMRWLRDIKRVSEMRVPRWYHLTSGYELHVFGDASESAYAAVAFLVGQDGSGKPAVAMVVGKARVAPLKVISVPRLELQAAVLVCRLAATVEKEQGVAISGRYLWTDSKTVLKWIRSDPRDFQKFVSHRLAEVDQKSRVGEWRCVPSAENPADEATKLNWPTNCNLWLNGPAFLRESKDRWPVNEYDEPGDVDLERIEKVHVVRPYEPLVDINRFSSWVRAVRATARVLAFIGICRKKQTELLTAENIREAELFLFKQSQAECFAEEIRSLSSGCVSPTSKIRSLDPILYDGLLRVRGRLSAAPDLTFEEKHPIILDGRSYTAQLLVFDYHRRAHHGNHETVMNCVRERFWITGLRRIVKAVVHNCQYCRIQRAVPSPPKMADLPAARLENTRRAFVNCGIDYFGPMEVAIGRRREKRWGVLFTCLVTRAIHLELASSLSADSAIMAIRRFIARRGQPSVMFSDRGTNFVGADAEMRASLRTLEHSKISDFVITKGISWQFNPPAAPHMGGCWERLVRSVKTALKTVLKERAPSEEVLLTLLAEVEMTINSRPLTDVSTEPDSSIALTPNHLLLGTASGASGLGVFDATDMNRRKAWRKAQSLADMFWRRWLREYVPTLQKRQKWLTEKPPVKVGDPVLIFEPNQPRNTWPRGVISAVHPGRDGQVRVVTVKTCKGLVQRPVVRVVVLPTDECV